MLSHHPHEDMSNYNSTYGIPDGSNWSDVSSRYCVDQLYAQTPGYDLACHTYGMQNTPNAAARHLPNYSAAYDMSRHGFSVGPLYPRNNSDGLPPHPGSPYHGLAYTSGRGLSSQVGSSEMGSTSTEHTFSDGAQTPEAIRHLPEMFRAFPSRDNSAWTHHSELAFFGSAQWSPQVYESSHSTFSTQTSFAACNLKELEILSGCHIHEEMEQDQTVTEPSVPLSEDLDLVDSDASPTDSGLGASIDDLEPVKEECLSEAANDNDSDPEYLPQKSSRASYARSHAKRPNRRRSSTSSRTPLVDTSARVQKPAMKRTSSQSAIRGRESGKRKNSKTKKPIVAITYRCRFHRYGCPAEFANKNEWKRHNLSQHLQLGFYYCDMGSCADASSRNAHKYFNRKDLFVSHCRRMHAPWSKKISDYAQVPQKQKEAFDEKLEDIKERCWHRGNTPPPKLTCGFCPTPFIESGRVVDQQNPGKAWEDLMDHLGRHVDREGRDIANEELDIDLHEWALRHGVIVKSEGGNDKYRLVDYDPKIGSMGRRKVSNRSAPVRLSNCNMKSEQDDDDDDDTDSTEDERMVGVQLEDELSEEEAKAEDDEDQDLRMELDSTGEDEDDAEGEDE